MNPEQLYETMMNPETRILKQISVEDAESCSMTIETLMGRDTKGKREFIETGILDI